MEVIFLGKDHQFRLVVIVDDEDRDQPTGVFVLVEYIDRADYIFTVTKFSQLALNVIALLKFF